MVRIALLLMLAPILLAAASRKTTFESSKERFNPWYSGPLLIGSAEMMKPNQMGIQPYVFVTDTFAVYDGDRKSHSIPSYVTMAPQMNAIQAGITSWLDASLVFGAAVNWNQGKHAGTITDTGLTLGFLVLKETRYIPAMKIGIGEVFPTGRYRKLKPEKANVAATGYGAFQTQLSWRISKILLWDTRFPLNLRFEALYTIGSMVDVSGFNVYGGGYGTRGRVHYGNSISLDFGLEWSFYPKWVFAADFAYVHYDHAKFVGTRGVSADGSPATVGYRSADQFSIAPAIEYNPYGNLSFILGGWFSATGRNIGNFGSAFLGASYTFQVID